MIQKFEFGFIQFNKIFIQLENPDIAHPYHHHHQTRRLLKASTSMLTEWIEKRFV